MKKIDTLFIIILIIAGNYYLGNQTQRVTNLESNSKTQETKEKIIIGKVSTKTISPKVLNENNVKHSTTFRNYLDTDGRSTIGVTHNIRIGKEYYTSVGITSRNNNNRHDIGLNMSLTKYW